MGSRLVNNDVKQRAAARLAGVHDRLMRVPCLPDFIAAPRLYVSFGTARRGGLS